jgi:putative methyltransferase
MSNGFVHSVKVPRIYKLTADIVRRVREDSASLKSLIYETKHPVSIKRCNNTEIN